MAVRLTGPSALRHDGEPILGPDDACWPQTVWGNLPEGPAYKAAVLESIRTHFIEHCSLQPAG